MVPLSASGFLLGTTVELFGQKDYKPILNLALLNGLLGYLFAVVYLLVDLGVPWRLYYPMVVSWGTAAVLFLVGWHVATYLTVQVLEVSETFFEWINWPTAKNYIHKGTIGKGSSMALVTYFVIKLIGLVHDNLWSYLPTGWGTWYMLEIGLGVVLPIILFSIAIRRKNVGLIRFTAFLTVAGLLMNRLNTALITFNWNLYQEIPHILETIISITLFALFVVVYRFLLYRLPILYSWKTVPARELASVPVSDRTEPISAHPEQRQFAKVVTPS
jgi:Ni/Fe-hydrogenase subunit HybB-like protein